MKNQMLILLLISVNFKNALIILESHVNEASIVVKYITLHLQVPPEV